MKNSIFAATIRSIKTFTMTNKNDKEVLCSVAILKMTDGSIEEVFAYDMDLTKGFALADVKRIPIGQPLYEDGPLSTEDASLVFKGAMTLQHAQNAEQAMASAEKLDM